MPVRSTATSQALLCPPERREEALRLLYQRSSEPLRSRLVAEALADAAAGRVDLSGLWIAVRGDRMAGALLTQPLAGRAAALWAPEIGAVWGRRSLAAHLVESALDGLRGQGVRVVQALLDPAARREAVADLCRGGLPRVGQLLYLGRGTEPPLEPLAGRSAPAPELAWAGYSDQNAGEFRAVLARTYQGSLDMPELEGVRSLDDVLASHRASGRFVPERWRLGRVPGEPEAAAILLLADQPERQAWEVCYLGLTPEARSRGLGRATLAHALDLARPHRNRLELAVDDRNGPAVRLYHQAGFRPYDRRAVHLRVFPDPAGTPP